MLQYLCRLIFLRQVGNRVWAVLFAIFFFFNLVATGQQSIQKISYFNHDIKAEDFTKNDYCYKILSSLADNNIKGLKWVYISFEGTVIIQLEESTDGHLYAYSKLVKYKLTGENHFRDFRIDSLLVPSALSGNLVFTDDDAVSIELPVEILLSGGIIDLEGVGIPIDSLQKLNARLQVEKFIYTRDQYQEYTRITRLINNYYAFSEVIHQLIDRYSSPGINRSQATDRVFLAWHEIKRVNEYAGFYKFSETLPLSENDPLGFIKKRDKAIRLEKRANTLSLQILNSNRGGSIIEKKTFCENFSGLTAYYSKLSETYQPYIASGFSEITRLHLDDTEIERIMQIAGFYDVFNKLEIPSTPQFIYNSFMALADSGFAAEKYVETLDILYNATLIEEYFEDVERSEQFDHLYVNTLDGLMTAYLQVAIVAYRKASFDMADIYYQKAREIYQLHIKNLSGATMSGDYFLNFIEQQLALAYGFMDDEKFRDGLRMVDQAKTISNQYQFNQDTVLIDSAFTIGYLGIYQQKLDSIGELIENIKIDQAMEALSSTQTFSSDKETYLNGNGNGEIEEYARSLFIIYFERGQRLMRSHEPENALFAFLEAQSISTKYLNEDHPELDSLIYNATVPVILDLVSRAEFHTWANRMDDANLLLAEALAMQAKFNQSGNQEINKAIVALKLKIKNRECVNLSNKIFEFQKIIENRIHSLNYLGASVLLDSSLNMIGNNLRCNIDDSKLTQIKTTNEPAFEFTKMSSNIETSFSVGDYDYAVSFYTTLTDLYFQNKIARFGIDEPNLKRYASQKKNKNFNKACAEFYIDEGQFKEAFSYLILLKQMKVPPKELRFIQTTIGTGMAEEDKASTKSNTERLSEYTNDDKWFRYFRSAYLKQ